MHYYFVNLIVTCNTLKSYGILISDLIEYCCHFVYVALLCEPLRHRLDSSVEVLTVLAPLQC